MIGSRGSEKWRVGPDHKKRIKGRGPMNCPEMLAVPYYVCVWCVCVGGVMGKVQGVWRSVWHTVGI